MKDMKKKTKVPMHIFQRTLTYMNLNSIKNSAKVQWFVEVYINMKIKQVFTIILLKKEEKKSIYPRFKSGL